MKDEDNSGTSTLALQGSLTFIGNILGKGLGFIFVGVATRLVTPSEYGLYTLGFSIMMFIQGFSSLNIYRSIDYFVPQYLDSSNPGKAKRALLNAFVIGIGCSSLGAVIVYQTRYQITSLFNEPKLVTILPVFCLLIPLQTTQRTLLSSFNSLKKMKYRVLVRDVLNPITRILAVIVLVTAGYGVIGLIGGFLFGLAVAILSGVIFLIYEAEWLRTASFQSISNRSLLSYSLPLVLAGVIYSLVGQIDFFFIGYFWDSALVGQYQVAYLLSSNLLIILGSITPVFKPLVSENSGKPQVIKKQYKTATRWVTMLTLPPAITLILAPETYLSILFTEQYNRAAPAVIVLVLGYLLNSAFGPEGMVLEGLGYTRLTLFNTIILVGVNGALNFLFVPKLGILGAGIATGTALTTAGLVGVLEIYHILSFSPLSKMLFKTWIAAFIPLILGWFVINTLANRYTVAIFLPILVLLSYVLVLRLISGFSEEDFQLASRIDRKLGYRVVEPIIGSSDRHR